MLTDGGQRQEPHWEVLPDDSGMTRRGEGGDSVMLPFTNTRFLRQRGLLSELYVGVYIQTQVQSGMPADLLRDAVLAWFVVVAFSFFSFWSCVMDFRPQMILYDSVGFLLISEFTLLGSLSCGAYVCVHVSV